MIDPKLLAIRDFGATDIPMVSKYWYESDPAYIEAMGVDLTKLLTREKFEQFLAEKCNADIPGKESRINAVVITYAGRAVGFHTINPLVENDYGVFHAHVVEPSLRRQGIAQHSYRMATKLFMKRFNLNRIIFKTPIQNIGPNRVKEKIGIRCIGEETVQGFNIMKDGTRVKVYELTRAEAENL